MMACSPGCSSGRGGGGELAVAGGTLQLVPTALGSKGSGTPAPRGPGARRGRSPILSSRAGAAVASAAPG